jgi:hypothetical protein
MQGDAVHREIVGRKSSGAINEILVRPTEQEQRR